MRVIATLVNKPRPDSDAQQPLDDGDTAREPMALLAPDDLPSSNVATAVDVGGGTPSCDAAPAAMVATAEQLSAPAAPAGELQAAPDAGVEQTEQQPAGQPEAVLASEPQSLDASVPVVNTGHGVLPAEPSVAGAVLADAAAGDELAGAAAVSALAVLEVSPVLLAAEEDAQQQERQQLTDSVSAAQQPPALGAPEPDMAAAPQPDPPALCQAVEAAPAPQATPTEPAPPRPQPPPPAQLLLLPDDASGKEVQAAALRTFRELYPIFEPFQARDGLPRASHCITPWGSHIC